MNDAGLRVLLVLPNLYVGGSQEAVRTLARHLHSDHCKPVVCALFDGGPLQDDLIRQGTPIEVLRLPRHRFVALPWFAADMLHNWRSLASIIEKYQINVIQTYLLGAENFLVLGLARGMGVPVFIINFRNERFLPYQDGYNVKNDVHRLVYRLARRWANDYVAVSEQTRRAMVCQLGLPEERITVVCNGVDVDQYQQPVDRARVLGQLGLSTDARLLITVATLKTQKGHCYLIEAASDLVYKHPDIHFLFVGDGELKAQLQAQTNALGLGDRVHFLGNRRDVSELLAASDVFVLPSLWEGMSMALLEAMAAAKPVVATAVSGTRQVLTQDETGLLVPPGDAGALARAIDGLLSHPGQARALGEAARCHVQAHFSTERQAAEYLALYRRLLAKETGTCRD